eukprot:scaffold124747_cov21-Tisochrysis_lutea.AAC.3
MDTCASQLRLADKQAPAATRAHMHKELEYLGHVSGRHTSSPQKQRVVPPSQHLQYGLGARTSAHVSVHHHHTNMQHPHALLTLRLAATPCTGLRRKGVLRRPRDKRAAPSTPGSFSEPCTRRSMAAEPDCHAHPGTSALMRAMPPSLTTRLISTSSCSCSGRAWPAATAACEVVAPVLLLVMCRVRRVSWRSKKNVFFALMRWRCLVLLSVMHRAACVRACSYPRGTAALRPGSLLSHLSSPSQQHWCSVPACPRPAAEGHQAAHQVLLAKGGLQSTAAAALHLQLSLHQVGRTQVPLADPLALARALCRLHGPAFHCCSLPKSHAHPGVPPDLQVLGDPELSALRPLSRCQHCIATTCCITDVGAQAMQSSFPILIWGSRCSRGHCYPTRGSRGRRGRRGELHVPSHAHMARHVSRRQLQQAVRTLVCIQGELGRRLRVARGVQAHAGKFARPLNGQHGIMHASCSKKVTAWSSVEMAKGQVTAASQ